MNGTVVVSTLEYQHSTTNSPINSSNSAEYTSLETCGKNTRDVQAIAELVAAVDTYTIQA